MNGLGRIILVLPLFMVLFTLRTAPVLHSQSTPSIIFRSPAPNSQFHPPSTTITVRYDLPLPDATLPSNLFSVRGERSGLHSGVVTRAADGKTLIFNPDVPFLTGETATVTLSSLTAEPFPDGAAIDAWTFQVSSPRTSTAKSDELLLPAEHLPRSMADVRLSAATPYVTVPDSFPAISVTVPASGTAPGYLFLSNFSVNWGQANSVKSSQPYLLILDDAGEPIFYRQMAKGVPLLDFKVQPNGMLTYGEWGGSFFVMNDSYQVVDTIAAGNGYSTDIHDLQILPNDNALLMIYDVQTMDMSQIVSGGDPKATVIGLVIQEIDSDKNVVFQWRSWDHIPITDSDQNLTAALIDYVHGNGLELDTDGTILLSSRNLDEVTKINRDTGDIVWRLGGKQNQFTFVGDSAGRFYRQHDVRRLHNGNITIFDNQNPSTSDFSRAVEYQLDEQNKQATLVWEYRNQDISVAMGNVQRLPNNNTLIGWGSMYPTLNEIRPDGSVALEISLAPSLLPNTTNNSYRVFRFPWVGKPTEPPVLMALPATNGTVNLYYSWNGATDIGYYRVYGGSGLENMSLIDVQTRQGFETHSVGHESHCFYQVMPMNTDTGETMFSNIAMNESCIAQRVFLPLISHD